MPDIRPTSAILAARKRMYMRLSAALLSPAARPRLCMCATCSTVSHPTCLQTVGLLSEAPLRRKQTRQQAVASMLTASPMPAVM